jgi:pyruvate formate-lyase/glycerol dehydratase family glycyl radical enzyme
MTALATSADATPALTVMPPLRERVRMLHAQVLATPPSVCVERALLLTEFYKKRIDRAEPVVMQKARALRYMLSHKQPTIHQGELLVGNFTAHRVGGGLYPELHGIAMLEDIWSFARRTVNPVRLSARDRWLLLRHVIPYWAPRFLAIRAAPLARTWRFLVDQMTPKKYLINETGGISHFVPDYATLVALGTEGLRQRARAQLATTPPEAMAAVFQRAVEVVCSGVEELADLYAGEADRLSAEAHDASRRQELETIARMCRHVPRHGARSFHEALQSIVFMQIALNIESLDNSVSLGRLDQILWPYYEKDVAAGALTAEAALELLGCFAIKLCEIVPVFSRRLTAFHGGLFNGQVAVVGGERPDGTDGTNTLSLLMIELMDKLRTRQPNWHARVHSSRSPAEYRSLIARNLANGAVSPAIYNDQIIVPLLEARGFTEHDARDYSTVGCVEPVASGKSYLSTDAALLNLGLCLELALNQGRRFASRRVIGAATPKAETCTSIADVVALLRAQIETMVSRLIGDLQMIEEANARLHPTPLTSAMIAGCIESGRDASAGGAIYNGSGVQGVGVVDVGDSLAAIDAVIFKEQRATMAELVAACRHGFASTPQLRARLLGAPKYGNDVEAADRWVGKVMELFGSALSHHKNTRGGDYAAGYYSVTAHQAFGTVVGALPSGRLAKAAFSSGIAPASGQDRQGPTASLRSAAALPLHLALNGVNLNLQLVPWLFRGSEGMQRMRWLLDGAFAQGCMQLQVNVLGPEILCEARDNPGRYPGLLVRVSGYSAYFDDLSPAMKQELIDRTFHDRV